MRIHKQDGITLIEVLVAMLILSIGVLALISLITNVVVASQRADQGAMIRILATDLQERAWIFSGSTDDCSDSSAMADLNNWDDHPMLNQPSMPPVALAVREEGADCILTVTPQGTMPETEYRVTGPRKIGTL
ncbi:type IV pilus modification protein PilV [Marinobacter nauticus]|uniref:Type IV pilus modification protein PilV n=1 Tax=Marinobacter nauticus TaxID=2743 RepID=A0A1M2UW47_MARNT|nr:type IV pilus modification protein PilV [Marinobacter nauticus]OJS99502.1 type IV pilus modification protein PilV [Marinobacter nauticus]